MNSSSRIQQTNRLTLFLFTDALYTTDPVIYFSPLEHNTTIISSDAALQRTAVVSVVCCVVSRLVLCCTGECSFVIVIMFLLQCKIMYDDEFIKGD